MTAGHEEATAIHAISTPIFTAAQLEQARMMEHVMLQVRCSWFGARVRPLDCAVALEEAEGELVALVDGSDAQADRLILSAAFRGACVVVTNFTRPPDMGTRLLRAGYRRIQQRGIYRFDSHLYHDRQRLQGEAAPALDFSIELIDERAMPLWNHVCMQAFGSRLSVAASLDEKLRAYRGAGERGRWYLMYHGDRPIATASLFQSKEVGQVLAVGTIPSYRGRGAASALMQRIVRDWQAQGRGILFLDVDLGSPAERLYARIGFRLEYARELYAPGGYG